MHCNVESDEKQPMEPIQCKLTEAGLTDECDESGTLGTNP